MLPALLDGSLVRLGAMHTSDAAIWARWQQDGEFMRLLDANPAFPRSDAQLADYIREGQRGREHFLFAIRDAPTEDLIGFIELGDVMWSNRNAWLSIGIGEPEYRGRGCGEEAMRLVLRFAFHELNLRRIQLTVFSYNIPAIRLYEKLGFRREGAHREFLERDGQLFDMFLYGLLRREWEAMRS